MKKLICLLALTLACLTSCNTGNKNNDNPGNFLPGTAWTDGKITVTFTENNITVDGVSASYSVTAAVKGVATYFNIDDLKVGDKVYVSGSAYEGDKFLVLTKQGGTGNDRFTQK